MYNNAIRLRPFSAAYVQTVNDRLAVIVKHLIQNRKRSHASTSNLNVSGTDAAQPT